MSPRREATSSVSPSARYASAVSGDRLSKYSTATLLEAGAAGRTAPRHGGDEPSGHWADSRIVGLTDRKMPRVSIRPAVRRSDRPTVTATPTVAIPPPAAGSGGSPGSRRTRADTSRATETSGAARLAPRNPARDSPRQWSEALVRGNALLAVRDAGGCRPLAARHPGACGRGGYPRSGRPP